MDGPFVHKRLTNPAKEELYKEIKKAMEKASLDQRKEELEKEKEEIESQLKNADLDENARKALERRRAEVEQRIEDSQAELTALINALKCKLAKSIEEGKCKILIGVIASMLLTEFVTRRRGGCFPGSATFVDKHGLHRKINSMHIGEVVQVSSNDKIRSEPVITFIHREPDLMQEFLKITTLKEGKSLTITQDHLLFVEKEGQVATIPARDVIIGDTVYVRDDHVALKKDAVQSISRVHEKGVYAPVTLSGTILVDDVHTSCYFDVLSHEWSHRAMGVARAVHHVSPWMLQWLSRVGEKDGFPGWCRLAHKMLTCLNFKNI